jgi:hypothetical protein
MFFFGMEAWSKYMKKLGIQRAVDSLKAKGLPHVWPTKVADPNDPSTFFMPGGKPFNKSECPCYQGYYLDGLYGAVKCSGTGELLPGIVWDQTCSKGYEKCPYFRREAE